MAGRVKKVPAVVLTRAKKAATEVEAPPRARAPKKASPTREKVVAALKKLHPMD